MTSDSEHRLGKFYLPARELEHELVAEMMKGSFVTKCDFEYHYQAFLYYCLHPSFKMISKGEEAPQYYVAWQGSRMILLPSRPDEIQFECPSQRQAESWLKTMQKMQREHPTKTFVPVYP